MSDGSGSVQPTRQPSPTPENTAIVVVNSNADPGTLGDAELTLREAMRLAVGELTVGELSLAESQQVSGSPGSGSSDVIRFDG